MSRCLFPEHHRARGYGALVAAVAVVVLVLRFGRIIEMTVLAVVYVAAGLLTARLVYAVVRLIDLPAAAKRNYPAAVWAAWRWRWLARNLALATIDRHAQDKDSAERKIVHPRARFRPDAHGLIAKVRTVPGCGRAEVEKAAPYIADAWRCYRVQVSQPRPGRLIVRGLRTDPLTLPLPAAEVLPPVFDGRHLVLGRDEWGDVRTVDLANLTGSVISGNPGRGKTESATSMAVQLVPSPVVDTHILDGGGCDWSPWEPAAVTYCDGDRDGARDVLEGLVAMMMNRRRTMEAERGTRNAWKTGLWADYRMQWLVIEEASWFLDLSAVKGDRAREAQVNACRGLVVQLLRFGRPALFHTTMVCQKATGTGGVPPDIRDLAGLRWCFGVATTDVAVGGLGDDIRQYPALNPALLQGPEHVGVATVLLRTDRVPYTMVKFPEIGEDLAAAAAARAAARRRDVVIPDDASELVS